MSAATREIVLRELGWPDLEQVAALDGSGGGRPSGDGPRRGGNGGRGGQGGGGSANTGGGR